MKRAFAVTTAAAALAVAAFCVPTTHAEPAAPTSQPAAAASYPLDVCVISGDKLGEMAPPVVETVEGREVRFCCKSCVDDFKKDVAASNKKMDEMIIEKQQATYPLKTCPVSGEELGSMGKPVMFVDHKTNRLIELCCKGCVKEVTKDATAALAKIDAAQAAAK